LLLGGMLLVGCGSHQQDIASGIAEVRTLAQVRGDAQGTQAIMAGYQTARQVMPKIMALLAQRAST